MRVVSGDKSSSERAKRKIPKRISGTIVKWVDEIDTQQEWTSVVGDGEVIQKIWKSVIIYMYLKNELSCRDIT